MNPLVQWTRARSKPRGLSLDKNDLKIILYLNLYLRSGFFLFFMVPKNQDFSFLNHRLGIFSQRKENRKYNGVFKPIEMLPWSEISTNRIF